ncbi:MAG: acyltransferase family protein [Desulfobacteraceae bacterium]|nr:acyltransferase family protein [Desulfobacteraceae bacterium]
MIAIFFYHCDRFFDFRDWHVKNDVSSLLSGLHTAFFVHWMMPLFFVISGASAYFALKSRTAGGYVKERFVRILLPFLILGPVVTSPPQIYLDRLTHSQFTGNFFTFFPSYFHGFAEFGGNFAWHGMHLWYLLYLFIFSMIALPVILPGKATGRSLLSVSARLFEHPLALFLLFLPLSAVDILIDYLGMGFSRATGGWSFLSYFPLFIYGYLIFSNALILETVRKYATIALIAAVSLSAYDLFMRFGVKPTVYYGEPVYIFNMITRGCRAWCWIIAILGFGRRFLNFNNPFLKYANESVLPFYILHQLIILLIGFYVVGLNLSIPGKYLLIATFSFSMIIILYHFLIRPTPLLRFLFGLRRFKQPA